MKKVLLSLAIMFSSILSMSQTTVVTNGVGDWGYFFMGTASMYTDGNGYFSIQSCSLGNSSLTTHGYGDLSIEDVVTGNYTQVLDSSSWNFNNIFTNNYVATVDNNGRLTLSTSAGVPQVQLNGDLQGAAMFKGCVQSATVTITSLPVYSDNAAALLGGLIAGQVYRSGDDLKIVH